MRIEEYAEKHGVTYRQVYSRIKRGLIPAVKRGKVWTITDGREPKFYSDKTAKAEGGGLLKDKLLEAQIKKIEQQVEGNEKKIREDERKKMRDQLAQIFSDAQSAWRRAGLSEKQIDSIVDYFDSKIKELEQ